MATCFLTFDSLFCHFETTTRCLFSFFFYSNLPKTEWIVNLTANCCGQIRIQWSVMSKRQLLPCDNYDSSNWTDWTARKQVSTYTRNWVRYEWLNLLHLHIHPKWHLAVNYQLLQGQFAPEQLCVKCLTLGLNSDSQDLNRQLPGCKHASWGH